MRGRVHQHARRVRSPGKEKPSHLNQVAGFWRRPVRLRSGQALLRQKKVEELIRLRQSYGATRELIRLRQGYGAAGG